MPSHAIPWDVSHGIPIGIPFLWKSLPIQIRLGATHNGTRISIELTTHRHNDCLDGSIPQSYSSLSYISGSLYDFFWCPDAVDWSRTNNIHQGRHETFVCRQKVPCGEVKTWGTQIKKTCASVCGVCHSERVFQQLLKLFIQRHC